jgi:hypothetical protein
MHFSRPLQHELSGSHAAQQGIQGKEWQHSAQIWQQALISEKWRAMSPSHMPEGLPLTVERVNTQTKVSDHRLLSGSYVKVQALILSATNCTQLQPACGPT